MTSSNDVQAGTDFFYTEVGLLLDRFFPNVSVTLTNKDPSYITPEVKRLLREKNTLMRAGKVDMAGALAQRIGAAIGNSNAQSLQDVSELSPKDLWEKVRGVTGKCRSVVNESISISAEELNQHYVSSSTDSLYLSPQVRTSCNNVNNKDSPALIGEYTVFRELDKLKKIATGPDGLPYWFLRLAAPAFVGLCVIYLTYQS